MEDNCFFPKAFVFQRKQGARTEARGFSYLAFSKGVYWKPVLPRGKAPISLLCFRNCCFQPLERLPHDSNWNQVETVVCSGLVASGPAVIIKIPERRKLLCFNAPSELVIVARNAEERDGWLHTCRLRIAPWKLLECRMKEITTSLPSSIALSSLMKEIPHLTEDPRLAGNEQSYGARGPTSINKPQQALDKMKDYGIAADTCKVYPDFVASVASVTKLFFKNSFSNVAERSNEAADIAVTIADATKVISVVSSSFQVVAMSLRLAAMVSEVKRGQKVLPQLCKTCASLLASISESIPFLIHPSTDVNPILISNVFKFQQEALDELDAVEHHMMRKSKSQFLHAHDLKKSEEAIENLEKHIVSVLNTVEVVKLKTEQFSRTPVLRRKPRVSPFFVGREEEMKTIKSKLDEYGSVAITQYGGAGKTQLMTAFVELAEKEGWIEEENSHWVFANGNSAQFLSSLATFAEALSGRLSEKDRNDFQAVLSALRKSLLSVRGKWLICLDNSDEQEVNGMIGDICSLVNPNEGNGWVIITSRQGGPILWDEMDLAQRILLLPLSVRNSMIVLWRRKTGTKKSKMTDEQVLACIQQLDNKEFQALNELADDKEQHGLGGLPLALAQAGSYMYRQRDSFSQYINLYNATRGNYEVQEVFSPIESGEQVNQNQRSIWTTWKINVSTLSINAQRAIRSTALFGPVHVPKLAVRNIDTSFAPEVLFRKYVLGELVENASLLQGYRDQYEIFYGMHRIIREFVILDMRNEQQEFAAAIQRAVDSLYICASMCLELSNDCIDEPPYSCNENAFKFAASAKNLLFSVFKHPDAITKDNHKDKIVRICFFTIAAYKKNYRNKEAALVCDCLCSFLMRKNWKIFSKSIVCYAFLEKGYVALNMCKYNVAYEAFEQVIQIRQEGNSGIKGDSFIARSFHVLGRVAEEKGELVKAEGFYQKSHDMYRELKGDIDCPEIVNSLHQLGTVALRRGDLEKAQSRYVQSLHMEQRMKGDGVDDYSISVSLYQLGRVALKRNHLEDAEVWYRRSLDMVKRINGQDHEDFDTSMVYHQLGMVFQERGDFNRAEDMYQKSLEISKRVFGEIDDLPSTATSYHHMGSLKEDAGLLKDAERLARKAVESRKKIAGADGTADLAQSLNQLGRILGKLGNVSEAENCLSEGLSLLYKLNGPDFDHPYVAESLHQLGKLEFMKGQPDAAEKYYFESHNMEQRMKGKDTDHPSIASIMSSLAFLDRKRGRKKEALEKFDLVVRMYCRLFGPSHYRVLKAESNLRECELQLQNIRSASNDVSL